jgi:hypothetical protein
MATDSTRPTVTSFQAQTELELLQLIVQEEQSYPWNPAEPGTEAYFAELEQMVATEWYPGELAMQGKALAQQLDQMWSTLPSMAPAPHTDLFQQLASHIPQQIVDSIVQRARQVLASNLSIADQMVQCVQELIPGWGEEDLQVLARPFAFAMRSSETESLEAALRSVRCAAWTELSGVEQARLSLALARYAIAQAPVEDQEYR